MTGQEAAKILSIFKAAYPGSYRDLTNEDAGSVVKLWAMIFADESFETVSTAVYYRIAAQESPYPPAPGEIRSLLDRLRNPDAETGAQAWASVQKALANGIYGAEEEFNKLSPAAKIAVGSANALREMAMDPNFNAGVEESHFLKAYANVTERLNEIRKIPQQLRPAIERLAGKLALEPRKEQRTAQIGAKGANYS